MKFCTMAAQRFVSTITHQKKNHTSMITHLRQVPVPYQEYIIPGVVYSISEVRIYAYLFFFYPPEVCIRDCFLPEVTHTVLLLVFLMDYSSCGVHQMRHTHSIMARYGRVVGLPTSSQLLEQLLFACCMKIDLCGPSLSNYFRVSRRTLDRLEDPLKMD